MHLAHRARGAAVEFVPNRVYAPATVDSLGLRGGETAYLVDFSGPPGFARALAGAGANVVVLGEPPLLLWWYGRPQLQGVQRSVCS